MPEPIATGRAGARTVGVEEEFLLVDRAGSPRAGSEPTIRTAQRSGADAGDDGRDVTRELKEQQVESGTATCSSMDDVAAESRAMRRQLSDSASAHGLRLAALATSPLPVDPTSISDERAAGMIALYGLPAREMLSCGCHVHVSVDSRDEGVAVLDRVRPWLPVLRALSSNSPYWQGEDTAYASYRTVVWNRLPTAGTYEPFGSLDAYEDVVQSLVESGSSLDRGTIYFDARLSDSHPTVEIRVADTLPTVADVVLVAALSRALVETAAREAAEAFSPHDARAELLRAAVWRSARSGLSGDLVDARTGRSVPAHALVRTFVEHVRPALASYGDEERVDGVLEAVLRRGTGAELQRVAFRRRGQLSDVVDDAVARTAAGSEI